MVQIPGTRVRAFLDTPAHASYCHPWQARMAVVEGAGVIAFKDHWVVRLNWRNRSMFFALMFVVIGTHLIHLQAGAVAWVLLALQCLVYPQCVYWRARRAANPLRAEMQNLLIDALLLGILIGLLGLPLWISFVLFIGVCLNLMVFLGVAGLGKVVLAMAAGVCMVAMAGQLQWRPHTSLATTLLCMLTLTFYLLMFAHDAYARGVALRQSRKQLGIRIEEITSLQARLEDLAARDPLTGLFNRRHLDEALARALAGGNGAQAPLTLVMIDIDHFKHINDTHGHLAGDEMIKALARLLTWRVRGQDLACRYGGEEFVLMLPGTRMEAAAPLADALRREFEELRVEFEGRSLQATLSFGLAAFPEHEPDPRVLLQQADKALYAAKLQGRNRVVLSTQAMEQAESLE